jgi:hypothetical protein
VNDEMPHDDELRALYRKLPADVPRSQIDDTILAAARRRSDVARRRSIVRRLRWTVPLAAAAGVVLTLTLTHLTPDQGALQRSSHSMAFNALPWSEQSGDSSVSAWVAQPPFPSSAQQTAPAYPSPAVPPASAQPPAPSYASPAVPRPSAQPSAAPPPAQPGNLNALGYMMDGSPAARVDQDKANTDERADHETAAATADAKKPAAAAKAEAARPMAPPPVAAAAPAAPPLAALTEEARGKGRALAKLKDVAPAREAKAHDELDAAGRVAGGAPAGAAASATAPEAGTAAGTTRETQAGGAAASDSATAACEAAPPSPPQEVPPWPFNLEAGLTADEACRRVSAALHRKCAFFDTRVDMELSPIVPIDRGRVVGTSASRLTLALRNGKLWSVVLQLTSPAGDTSQAVLVAPDAPAPPPPR